MFVPRTRRVGVVAPSRPPQLIVDGCCLCHWRAVRVRRALVRCCSAQLYMVIKASKENTKGGEGVVVLKNEPFDNTDGHWGVSPLSGIRVPRTRGQYTLKEYHLASRVPGFVKVLLPSDMLVLVEEAWNAYPECRTVLTNAGMDKEKFKIDIESRHLPDAGTTENALALSAEELKERKVQVLDIREAFADKTAKDYRADYDSSLYRSTTTGRGPLAPGWQRTTSPVMCCYKVVRAHFRYWGAQTKVEKAIEKQQYDLFSKSLSQAFCLTDEWHSLTMADIRRLEASSAAELRSLVPAAGAGAAASGAGAGGGGGGSGGAPAPATGAGAGAPAAAAPAATPAVAVAASADDAAAAATADASAAAKTDA